MIEVEETVSPAVRVKTPAEVLQHAAMYIEEHGWVQGNYIGPNGQKCAIGAIIWAARGNSDLLFDKTHPGWDGYVGARRAAERQLKRDGYPVNVVAFNDSVAKTASQVTELLRNAASNESNA